MFYSKIHLRIFILSLILAAFSMFYSCFGGDNCDKTETPNTPPLIVFVKDEAPNYPVYKQNADGTGSPVLVSPSTGIFDYPTLSNDQKKVVFTESWTKIYIISIDNNGTALPEPLIDSGSDHVYMPAYSKDGAKIAFQYDASISSFSGIYIADASTGSYSKITNSHINASHPSWSPDGSSIVYSSSGILYTISATDMSDTPHKLCDETASYYPIWSPAGNTIAFIGSDGLRLVTYIGGSTSSSTSLTTSIYDYTAYWSPDGTNVIFSRNLKTPADQWDMMSIRVSDKSETNITNTPGTDEIIYNG
jgi:TolB protein